MIIDKITAVRVIPPRMETAQTPIRRPREVEAAYVVGAGERRIAEGTTGNVLDVCYDEIEIDLYTPRDWILSATPSQVRSA